VDLYSALALADEQTCLLDFLKIAVPDSIRSRHCELDSIKITVPGLGWGTGYWSPKININAISIQQ
jgi:hypothetical protein